MKRIFLSCLFLSSVVVSARASIIISVGEHELLPNQPGQEIEIFVTGDEEVQGLNFNAQIVGPDPAPLFQDVDLITGTIFESNHNPPTEIADLSQLQVWSLTTSTGTVLTDGLLATLTVDTTGIFGGTWGLNLEDTDNGPTDFANDLLPVTITDGSISVGVIPEPSSLTIFAGLLLAMVAFHAAAHIRRRSSPSVPTA